MFTFIYLFLGEESRILAKEPIKIPSGKYVETLRVERTQQDLNNEMANALSNLPRFQAYTKIIHESNGQQSVNTHRMQTRSLPAAKNPGAELQAITNAHTLCKTRDDIETEIRERQNRWGRGSAPPQQAKRVR